MKTQKIRAVLFDVGGVIIDDRAMKQRACDALGVTDPGAFWNALNEAGLPACRGEEHFSMVWKRVAKMLGLSISEEVANSLWIDDFEELVKINHEVLSLVRLLRQQVVTGIISNTVAEHAKINKKLGIYEPFDHLVLSHEVGLTKDTDKIFDIALKRVGLPAAEVVFIDDVERFRSVAAGKGMTGLLFKNVTGLKAQLKDLGLNV